MLAQRFSAALEFLGPYPPQPHFAVALSGGADSMALTLLVHEWLHARGGKLTALTVDHRLRDDSTAEAQQVQQWMHARGIAHHILTPTHTDDSNNLQEAARGWRYDALADFCGEHGILHCLVAHQAGDQRETAALHAARGDTADGDAGMSVVRNYRNVRFLRPLLSIQREELEKMLQQCGAAWIEDPSNQNQKFARVRLRHKLSNDTIVCHELDAQLADAAQQRIARDHALADAAMRLVTIHPLGFAELSLSAWRALEPTLASQLIADCITTISGATHRPRAQDTARLVAALSTDFAKRTLQHCEVTLKNGTIRIAREAARVAPPINLTGQGKTLWDGRFRVRYDVPEGTSLTLAALGPQGRKHLRATQQAPADLPLATPAYWHLDTLLGVPHITPTTALTARVTIGFAPPKPLAAAPFWWLNHT